MEHCMFSKLKICKRSSASLYSCEPEGSAEQNFRVVVKGKYLLLKEKVHTQTLQTKAAQRKHIILQHLNEAGGWTQKIILYNLVGRHCTHVKRQTTLKKKKQSRLRGWLGKGATLFIDDLWKHQTHVLLSRNRQKNKYLGLQPPDSPLLFCESSSLWVCCMCVLLHPN